MEVGFLTLLQKLKAAYITQPERVAASSTKIAQAIQQTLAPRPGQALPQAEALHEAVRFFRARFDSSHGGAKGAPKFPSNLPPAFCCAITGAQVTSSLCAWLR